jgi:hypothetical protein
MNSRWNDGWMDISEILCPVLLIARSLCRLLGLGVLPARGESAVADQFDETSELDHLVFHCVSPERESRSNNLLIMRSYISSLTPFIWWGTIRESKAHCGVMIGSV